MYKIIIVEDEESLGEILNDYLKSKGFVSHLFKTYKDASNYFRNNHSEIKVSLLDIGLPDGNGLDLAKEMRSISSECLFLFLSAQNDPQTRLKGLELGAQDYIVKPFELKELELRLNRILKLDKKLRNLPDEIGVGKLRIFFSNYQVQDAHGSLIDLSQKECAILELLYINKHRVLSRDEIINSVWGEDSYPSNRTVDNYIVKLRKWAETDESNILEIQSIRAIGYKLIIKE